MATILVKSYTDIKQSKILAEILSYDTADNTWERVKIGVPEDQQYVHDGNMPFGYYSGVGIPCWSLAALLDVLPGNIKFKDNKYYLRFMKDYVEYANDVFSITGRCLHTTGNNLVDACYNMILKLNELKLL